MIARIATPDELDACFALRHRVFVDEQQVPPELELDGLDAACTHFAVGSPICGTARLREVHGDAKAERVAVEAAARGTGAGRALMAALEAEAARRGLPRVVLYAQLSALPFYERLGYTPEGPVFDDAGIPHRKMTRVLG